MSGGPDPAHTEQYDETAQLAWVDRFMGAQHTEAAPLGPVELGKLDDLRDDLLWLQRCDHRGVRSGTSLLGALFTGFEALWSYTSTAAQTRALSLPPSAPPVSGAFLSEWRTLDRLSLHYGGQYRGAVVVNYFLALLATFCALAGRIPKVLHMEALVVLRFEVVTGLIEVAAVLLVIAIYLTGRTPKGAFRAETRYHGWSRRWHQRWLEYRVLAERFRYAGLLARSKPSLAEAWRGLIAANAIGAWHERYFLWRVAQEHDASAAPGERARLVATMDEQRAYHQGNAERRGRIERRLDRCASGLFVLAVALLVVHVAGKFHELVTSGEAAPLDTGWTEWLPLVTTAVVAVSGMVHAVAGTLEYARIAETSRTTAARIDAIAARIAPASGDPEAQIEPAARQFCALVTEEATGWKQLLRDKNVPLPG